MARNRPPGVRPAGGRELLYGVHPVREALRSRRRRLYRCLTRPGDARPEIAEILQLAREAGVRHEETKGELLADSLEPGSGNAQGVLLEAGPLPECPRARDLLANGANFPHGIRLVALDGVEDPQNVGAIARVADAAGVAGLVLTDRRSPPLSPALARASAGAIEWLPVARVTNLPRALEELKQEGLWVVGADPAGPDDIFSVPDRLLAGNLVVVLGAEGKGLRPGVVRLLDHPLRIPMLGRVASMNVATAAAVMLFELVRRSAADRRG